VGLLGGRKRARPRACVFGIDGLPHTLLRRLMASGVMPHANRIFASGLRRMTVTLPEISAVSWTSFMTGAGPGAHGVYGFTEFEPGGYGIRFPLFPALRVPTIWDRLGRKGKRSVVLNQPSTYPAREIPGILVSGFVAVKLERAVWPAALAERLRGMEYRIDVDTEKAAKDADFLFRDLEETHRSRRRAFDFLWREEKWDLFEVVLTGTDRLQHYQYDTVEDESSPNHARCLEYYASVDAFLGHAHDRYVTETGDAEGIGFFALSDHGFTRIRHEFYLNAWLVREGYLAFRSEKPASFEEADPQSRAFGLDPTRIYLHRRDRFPRGCVGEGEVRALREEIREKLLALRHEGEPVLRAVHLPEEIYEGPRSGEAPDLVLLAHDGFDVKGWMRTGPVFGRSRFTGMHNWDDAFLWNGGPMPDALDITGIAAVVEERLGA
jgi:predicted AlkP superfamily phosphohydrolase/phosphomutase